MNALNGDYSQLDLLKNDETGYFAFIIDQRKANDNLLIDWLKQ